MGVARGGLNLRVTEQLVDHWKAFAEGQSAGRKGVTEVMDSDIVELRAGADAAARGAEDRSDGRPASCRRSPTGCSLFERFKLAA